MKRIALTVSGLLLVVLAIAQQMSFNKSNSFASIETAAFSWSSTDYNFGKIQVGTPVTHEFEFTNSGSVPLIITSVQASCGCTVTAYSKEPIAPGRSGFVRATYNAAHVGQFSKTVTVNANTDQPVVQLTINGEVIQ